MYKTVHKTVMSSVRWTSKYSHWDTETINIGETEWSEYEDTEYYIWFVKLWLPVVYWIGNVQISDWIGSSGERTKEEIKIWDSTAMFW